MKIRPTLEECMETAAGGKNGDYIYILNQY